jgi:opacity protein-like surface antigen
MNTTLKAGLASALTVAGSLALSTTASAADLYGGHGGGSLKDGYVPVASAPVTAGPCYGRADTGYSWNRAPKATYVGNAGGADPAIRGEDLDSGTVSDVGIGCGSGSRGFRAEIMFGLRAGRDFKGDVDIFVLNPVDPPIKASLDTYTVMVNGYYDFGNFRGFVPYVGVGLGLAVHDMGFVTIDHPLSPNPQFGETKADLAWSLMAGVGYQLSSNAILDIGYRYISLGSAHSHTEDVVLGGPNPRLIIDDMAAHELKVGMRYHFGSAASCCNYAPMK